MDLSTLAFFSPSPGELMIVALIALLLFGKRLPDVARSLGKGIVEFKRGVKGIEDEVDTATYEEETSNTGRPIPHEEQDEITAPKFEPPTTAPEAVENKTGGETTA